MFYWFDEVVYGRRGSCKDQRSTGSEESASAGITKRIVGTTSDLERGEETGFDSRGGERICNRAGSIEVVFLLKELSLFTPGCVASSRRRLQSGSRAGSHRRPFLHLVILGSGRAEWDSSLAGRANKANE